LPQPENLCGEERVLDPRNPAEYIGTDRLGYSLLRSIGSLLLQLANCQGEEAEPEAGVAPSERRNGVVQTAPRRRNGRTIGHKFSKIFQPYIITREIMEEDKAKTALAAIKAREAEARAAIERGESEIEIGQFAMPQLGLSVAVADRFGRIWRVDGTKLVLVHAAAPHNMPESGAIPGTAEYWLNRGKK